MTGRKAPKKPVQPVPEVASDTDAPPDSRMELLVLEYMKDLDLIQAGRRAGYTSLKRAEEAFLHPWTQLRVREACTKRAKRLEISTDNVLQEIARIAFADPSLVMSWDNNGITLKPSTTLTEDVKAAVASVVQQRSRFGLTMEVKFHDKLKALEMLGRHLRMWHGTTMLIGPDGRPIDFDNMSRADLQQRIDELTAKRNGA